MLLQLLVSFTIENSNNYYVGTKRGKAATMIISSGARKRPFSEISGGIA
jgi:hypothetical protein